MSTTLGDRVRHIVGAVPRVRPDAGGPARADARPARRPVDVSRLAQALGGHLEESPEGAVVVVDRRYPADRPCGRQRVGELVEVLEGSRDAVEVLARAWPARRLDDVPSGACASQGFCFFDLETTGLAGGAGTVAFLVGCATVEQGDLTVRQFLLPGFADERALLAVMGEWARTRGTLVTFNGRTFDLPLIETRYLIHRLPFPLEGAAHLDMLPPARRLWKERPGVAGPPLDDDSCRLPVLERHVGGYHRAGDVPGFEIPARYFGFVRDGDARPLEGVLAHNRADLVSLALITARALALVQRGPDAAGHACECLGLGHIYERAGLADNAEACFARAAALAARVGRHASVRAEALRRLAICRRRARRPGDAAAAWSELLAVGGCPPSVLREAREALAIHHEHRVGDLDTARRLALDALDGGPSPRWRARTLHRLERLDRKLSRRATLPLPIPGQ